MKLLIANRNYSSWSLRAWLVMRHFGIEFEEDLLLLSGPGAKEALAARSPTGRVPVLIDGEVVVPETIAIIEYLADAFPEKRIWPVDRIERARARAASAEMHAGFLALRSAAPMNLRSSLLNRVALDPIAGDLHRLEALWSEALDRSGGPYLFGQFGAVDAMFAPVATRVRIYGLPISDCAERYVEAIYALPAFQEWLGEALKEPWVVDDGEIDVIQGHRAPGTIA